MYKWATLLIFDSSFSSHFLTKFIVVNVTASSCSPPLSPSLPSNSIQIWCYISFSPSTSLKIFVLNEMTHLARFLATGDPPRLHVPCNAISLFHTIQLPNIDSQPHWRLHNSHPQDHTRGSTTLVLCARMMLHPPPLQFHDCVVSSLCATPCTACAPTSRESCFARQRHDDSRTQNARKLSNIFYCARFQVLVCI